jgi:carbonic anhydrase
MSEMTDKIKRLTEARRDYPFASGELLKKTGYRLSYDRPLIVRCFDSRLDTVFDEFLKENGWSHRDVISLPGGARVLASDDPADATTKRTILEAIETSVAAHEAKWILLTIHFDCKGYRIAFPSDQAEQERQKDDLVAAVRTLREKLSAEFFVEGRYVDGYGIHPV